VVRVSKDPTSIFHFSRK